MIPFTQNANVADRRAYFESLFCLSLSSPDKIAIVKVGHTTTRVYKNNK